MSKGLLGKKLGMTQIFVGDGQLLPVTVIEVTPNVILEKKTKEKDGYSAIQLGFGDIKEKKVIKPLKGFFEKLGQKPVKFIRELKTNEVNDFTTGQVLKADVFADGDIIDVVGTAKGKGFAGGIKRHNFARGPMAHGSKSHREPGTIGPRMSGGGGKVFKGKKLPGHMGGQRVTVQRLTIVKVDVERNLLLVKGAVPGPKGSLVLVKETVKPKKK